MWILGDWLTIYIACEVDGFENSDNINIGSLNAVAVRYCELIVGLYFFSFSF